MSKQAISEILIDPRPTPEEYKTAALIAARRLGTLRPLVPVVILSAGLLLVGLSMLGWFRTTFNSIVLPLALCAACPALLAVFFLLEPRNVRSRAMTEFRSLGNAMDGVVIRLETDDLAMCTPRLQAREPYALMLACVETPDMFVLLRDRERLLVLPKRSFPPDRAEEINEQLRHIFARRRVAMRGWIF